MLTLWFANYVEGDGFGPSLEINGSSLIWHSLDFTVKLVSSESIWMDIIITLLHL